MQGIVAALLIATLAYMAVEYKQCNDAGGTYVRGFVWMECINGD